MGRGRGEEGLPAGPGADDARVCEDVRGGVRETAGASGRARGAAGALGPAGAGGGLASALGMVVAFLGAALYWPLLRRNALFYSLAGHDETVGQAVAWYGVYLACVLLVVVASWALARRRGCFGSGCAGRGCAGLAAVLVVGVVQAGLKVVEVLAGPTGALGAVVAAVGTLLYAALFVLLTYLWAAWYATMASRTAALVAIGSFIASLTTRTTMFLPDPAGLIATACLPLLSLVLWLAAARARVGAAWRSGDAGLAATPRVGAGTWNDGGAAAGVGELPTRLTGVGMRADVAHAAGARVPTRADDGAAGAGRPAVPVRLIAVLAGCLVLGGLVRGFVSGYVNGEPLTPAMSVQDAISIVFAALLFAYTFFRSSSRAALQGIWPAATILFFAGLLLLANAGWGPSDLGSQVVIVGRTCLDLLLWIVLVDAVREGRLTLVGAFGLVFVVVDVASSLLGYVAVPLVLGWLGASPEGLVPALASIAAFVLVTVSVLFFSRSFGVEAPGGGAGVPRKDAATSGASDCPASDGSPATTLGALDLGAYGLSEREMTVAALLADGNSQRKIAELLGISMGTVQSHVKAVYRKLDIHSKQELIDLTRGR